MKIELYLIPPGNRDFRKTLIEKAIGGLEGPDYSDILYLAPTRHMLGHFQKEFHTVGGPCYIPPQMATLREFSRRLYSRHNDGLLFRKKIVPLVISGLTEHGMGLSTIVSKFISDMKNHFPQEDIDSIRLRFKNIFGELDIPDEVSSRAFDALDIFARYGEALKAAGAVDEDDVLVHAASIAQKTLKPRVLVLEGFYEVTPAEFHFLSALISNASKTLISIPISHSGDDLSHCCSQDVEKHFDVEPVLLPSPDGEPALDYTAGASREEELEGIARHIKSSFVSGRLRELDSVYLAFPKFSEYRDMLHRVFTRYGIPYSPEPPDRRPLKDLLSLLEAVRDGLPRLATARFLTSPYFKNIPEGIRKATPNISLEAGTVRGKDSWLRAFKTFGLKSEGIELFKKLTPFNNIANKGSYSNFIDVLLEVLKALDFSPDEETPDGYEGVLKALNVLDSVPGIQPTDLRGFTDALKNYLKPESVAEEETPGIHVGNIRDLRGLEPDYLYLGGLKDGDLPARPEMDLLLPDSVRARLGLGDMHRHLRLQGYIFRRLVSTAGHLRLSYPSMEGDKLFLPSLYLRGGNATMEKIFGDFSSEEALTRRAGEPLAASLREIAGIKGYRRKSPVNVTDIDAYRACPRRFFIEKVLKLEPPEIREYEVDPRTIGSIVHEVMENLIGPPLEGIEAFTRRAGSVLKKVLGRWPIEPYFKALIKESFLAVLPQIYELEEALASEGYTFDRAEYKVSGEPLPGIKLKGKVDRIDVKNSCDALVLDYKTGSASLSSTRTLRHGATLQPFIYAALLKAEGAGSPESVGIYSLKDIRINRVPNRIDRREGRTLDYFIESALLYLDSTVSAMREGNFKAHPLSEASCRYCHERPYCPYIQGNAV